MRKFIFSITILTSLLFTSCCSDKVEETAKPDVSLTNTYFKVLSFGSQKVEVFDKEPHIKFDSEGKVSGHLGCNSFFGTFKIEDKKISLDKMGSTRMMCPNMKTEDTFSKVLREVKTYEIKGETLNFYNENGEKLSVFEAVYF